MQFCNLEDGKTSLCVRKCAGVHAFFAKRHGLFHNVSLADGAHGEAEAEQAQSGMAGGQVLLRTAAGFQV